MERGKAFPCIYLFKIDPIMSNQPKHNKIPSLFEVEMETLEEGREWTRRRLEQKLQKLAEQQGAISPPQRPETEERQAAPGDDPDLRRGDHP
jgi:hypothetical protein